MANSNFYAVIPADVMADPALKPNAKLLYGMVTATASAEGCSAASNATFAAALGISPRSVTALLSCLEEAGYLRVELDLNAPSDGSSTRRKLWLREADPLRASTDDGQPAYAPDDADASNSADPLRQAADTPHARGRRPPASNSADPPAGFDPCKVYINNNNNSASKYIHTRESPQTCATAHAPGRAADGTFDRFWRTYPRKVDKQRARKVWDALAPSPALADQIIAAVEQECRSPQWQEPQYIPHPRTWLSNRRWEAVTVKPRTVREDNTGWW